MRMSKNSSLSVCSPPRRNKSGEMVKRSVVTKRLRVKAMRRGTAAAEEEDAEAVAALVVASEVLLTAKVKEVDVKAREAVKLNLRKKKRLRLQRVRRSSASVDLDPIEEKGKRRMKRILQESEAAELVNLAVEAVVTMLTSLVKGLAGATGIKSRKTEASLSLKKTEVALAADPSLEDLKVEIALSSLLNRG